MYFIFKGTLFIQVIHFRKIPCLSCQQPVALFKLKDFWVSTVLSTFYAVNLLHFAPHGQ